MLTREKLSQLSEEELEKLYQEKKAEYDQKMSKNRRIRGMMSRKVDEKQKTVTKIQKENNEIFAAHPELSFVKENFYHSYLWFQRIASKLFVLVSLINNPSCNNPNRIIERILGI